MSQPPLTASFLCRLTLAMLAVVACPCSAHPQSQSQRPVDQRAPSHSTPVRLALINEEPSAVTAADLLMVELSSKSSLQLLERAEIQRIYREQGLSAANEDYLKLGQILGADGLLLVSMLKEGTNQFLQARLIAAKPAVVLGAVRSPWPASEPTQWARGLVKHFGPYFPKLGVLAKDAVPVSVLNLRSAVRTAEAQSLEKELTLLLVHRLAQQRELFLLERQHMRELFFEQQLKLEDEAPFWTGRYLLDGTLDKDGFAPDRVTISARLVAPHGGGTTLIEVSGPRNDPASVTAALAAKVLAVLQRSPTSPEWRPAQEAEQFYEEATWAHRFGLLREAQMASESAWALGRRSRELAALRVESYAEDIYPEDLSSGNLDIPAIPDPTRLGPALRALELFADEAPRVFTNRAEPDVAWYELGVSALRRATALLDGFYVAAELRRGNEEQLAELRLGLRQVGALLETNVPLKRLSAHARDINFMKWVQGGLWFEKPEDSLPMFQRILERGYAPMDLPRLAGWSWGDRKRVPAVVSRFVQEVCACTNPAVRLEGLYLSLLRTPFDTGGRFRQCETALLAELWEQRQVLFTNQYRASLCYRTEQALLKKQGYVFSQHFDQEPFASCRHRLRADYLAQARVWDREVFQAFFEDPYVTYSAAEARELIPAVRDLAQKFRAASSTNKWAATTLEQFARRWESSAGVTSASSLSMAAHKAGSPGAGSGAFLRSGLAAAEDGRAPQTIASKGARPLPVELIEWKLKRPGIEPGREPRWENGIARGGKLWFLLQYSFSNTFSLNPQSTFLGVDPESGRCEEIAFPAKLGAPGSSFEVSDDSLFAMAQNQVQRYRFGQRSWESIPVPVERGAHLAWLSGRLYLSTAEGILELEPDSRKVQVLVSTRRRPAVNELDSAWGQKSRAYVRSDGKLGVVATNRVFAFAPAGGVWKSLPDLSPEWGRKFGVSTYFTSDAVLFYGSRAFGQDRLVALWTDSPSLDFLMEYFVPNAGAPKRQQTQPPPRWDWPSGYPLDLSCLLAEARGLWILTPRTRWRWDQAAEEPVVFQDQRQATLFRFTPESRQPGAVPIRFAKAGRLVDPFAYEWHKSFWRMQPWITPKPLWLSPPPGLVVACPNLAGHWLLPATLLRSNLQAVSEPAPVPSGGNVQAEQPSKSPPGIGAGPTRAVKSSGALKP